MVGDIEEGSTRGLSRRQLIKASAVAGAAAWTAPMIIDSLSSPAAAASQNCGGGSLTCSWIYVLYRVSGTYYVSGFNLAGTTCGGGGSNTHAVLCNTSCPAGISFTINLFNGGASGTDFSYSTSNACGGGTQLTPTYLGLPTCSNYVIVDHGFITATGGAEILAADAFGAGSMHSICPSGTGPNNQICTPQSGC
jgi:hypothetical protein